jgi:hypothetical protein
MLVNALLGHCDQTAIKGYYFIPHNNSLTIIDFDLSETDTKELRSEARLIAHNLHVISNEPTGYADDF